jgi:hypothetical protein
LIPLLGLLADWQAELEAKIADARWTLPRKRFQALEREVRAFRRVCMALNDGE